MIPLLWSLATPALATSISRAVISDTMPSVRSAPPGALVRAWTFCPTDRVPCDANQNPPLWLEVDIDEDSFTARAKDAHDSARRILDTSAEDLKPVAEAIRTYLKGTGRLDEASEAAVVQGLVQGPLYALDDTTGWSEYPKYSLEFMVDEQGDCDDAAITVSALLHDLGLDSWIVLWKAADGGQGGHLSAAVTRAGTLANWPLPPGSDWIPGPTGAHLLHVDGVGNTGGCGGGCAPLGWNDWSTQPTPMKVTSVVAFDDENLDGLVPLAAWTDSGRRRPKQQIVDRRKDPPSEVLARARAKGPHAGKLRAQLAGAGLSPDEATAYLDAQTVDNAGYYGVSALTVAGLTAAAVALAIEKARRREHLERERRRRDSARF